MKKACAAAGFGTVLALSGLAGATPLWTDAVGGSGSATHTFNNGHPTYSYTYDIANLNSVDGNKTFLPGTDRITSAELVLYFKNSDSRDSAEIKIGDFTTTVTNTTEARIQLPANVLNQWNSSGTLPVSITATNVNSFRLENSVMNVNEVEHSSISNGTGNVTPTGNGATPVPEPSTFILLGACLGGLAFWRKRAMS